MPNAPVAGLGVKSQFTVLMYKIIHGIYIAEVLFSHEKDKGRFPCFGSD
jgi:hypothetical protein